MASLPQLIEEDLCVLDTTLQSLLRRSEATLAMIIDKAGFILTNNHVVEGAETIKVSLAGATDVGRKRQHNEDAFAVDTDLGRAPRVLDAQQSLKHELAGPATADALDLGRGQVEVAVADLLPLFLDQLRETLGAAAILGRSFWREHFGKDVDSPVLWLPDVFGYAWALPQLIQQAGLKYFMTIKIGWSQYNRLPYDTFMWQGIDGTQPARLRDRVAARPAPGRACRYGQGR